jgi:hypothetical protein
MQRNRYILNGLGFHPVMAVGELRIACNQAKKADRNRPVRESARRGGITAPKTQTNSTAISSHFGGSSFTGSWREIREL